MAWGSMGDIVPMCAIANLLKKYNVKLDILCFYNYKRNV